MPTMIKQILSRLPRSSKGSSNEGNGSASLVMHNRRGSKDVRLTPFPICSGTDKSFEPLPSFRDVPSSERASLFIRKLDLCCVVFDLSDATKNVKEKEIKRQNLLELVDFVGTCTTKFSAFAMEQVIRMVRSNIVRPRWRLKRQNTTFIDSYDREEEKPPMDPSWPHLQLVYEILLRFIMLPEVDPKLCKSYINQKFVNRLIGLSDRNDPRERECIKTIINRIYGKFTSHRPYIKSCIDRIILHFNIEGDKHSGKGIGELLETLSSIINDFALPLKEEHKLFLFRSLIPLHKHKHFSLYHRQLTGCIIQFLKKDFKLADTIIRGLLKFWPITNSSKEVLFLGELEEILELTQPAELQRCMVPVFKRIGQCLNSSHFQVADRAFSLWNNNHIVSLVTQNRAIILPLVTGWLEKNTSHWNQAVVTSTMNARKLLMQMDEPLYLECKRKFEEDEPKKNNTREVLWQQLEAAASSKRLMQKPKQEILLLKNTTSIKAI